MLIGVADIKKTNDNKGENVEERIPCSLQLGLWIDSATVNQGGDVSKSLN